VLRLGDRQQRFAYAITARSADPYYTMPLLVLLVAAGAAPTWRWAWCHRPWASGVAALGAIASVVVALPVLPARALGSVLAVNREQGEQVGWRELTMSVAQAWKLAGPHAVIFTADYGQARGGAVWAGIWPAATLFGPHVVLGPVVGESDRRCRMPITLGHQPFPGSLGSAVCCCAGESMELFDPFKPVRRHNA
jgi:hypothetical protein